MTAAERRCRATNRRGSQCGRTAPLGSRVCSFHGAKSPQAKRKAAERVAEQADQAVYARYAPDASPLEDPIGALLGVAGEITGFKDFVGARVAELRAEGWRYRGEAAEQLRSEVAVYERSLDRAARVLIDISKLGLEERRVQIYESQGQMFATVLNRIFVRLELSAEQRELVPVVVPEELRRVIAGETA